jgi:C1A family cysteine protease/PKD repeat protein
MKTRWSAVFCLIMVLLVSLGGMTSAASPGAGGGPQELQVTERDNGRAVDLGGDVLVLNLESNPSTGYGWQVRGLDARILRQLDATEWLPDTPGKLGGPGTEVLRFAATGRGRATLDLVYARPWETAAAPAKSFSLEVNVAEPSRNVSYPQPAIAELLEVTAGEESLDALPSAYNWCSVAGCTPVRDQGNCGSCWAFGTVGPLEQAILIQDGLSKDLAEQYLVSCNINGWGCNGGWWAHNYHQWLYPPGEPSAGAVYEADFPYTATNAPCNPPHTHHETIADWVYIGNSSSVPSTDAIKQAILDHGPVSAALCVNTAFQLYTGGVFESADGCSDINHAITLVGWDDSLGSQGAWRLRNSWGPGWGEDGYMWIAYGKSDVGYSANYVVYEGSTQPTPPTVSIADPVEDQSIAGIYHVLVEANDDSAVNQVELRIDGGAYINITANVDGMYYFYDWDTTAYAEGSHTLRARATDDAAQSTESTLVNVTVDNPNQVPVATFVYGCTGLSCTFDGSASYDPDGTLTAYVWDFGDEGTGSGMTASHTYDSAGTYNVVLTVTDNEDATDDCSQGVEVSEAATMHVGDLDGTRTDVRNKWNAQVTITVHDAAHGPIEGATVSGTWNGGATGTGQCTTGPEGICTVTETGISKKVATVTFTVDNVAHTDYVYAPGDNDDVDGNSNGTSIVVPPPVLEPPVSQFSYSCDDLACTFDASDSYDPDDGNLTAYDWVFGDGDTGSGMVVEHTYLAYETYMVSLTVTDDEDATGDSSQWVTVSEPGGTMHIGDLDGAGTPILRGRWEATVYILVHDGNDVPLANATVTGIWSNGATGGTTCVTEGNGWCSVTKKNLKSNVGSVTWTVDTVTYASSVYDAASNHDPETDSNGTIITVSQP